MSKAEISRQRILEYIRERIHNGEPSPTVREICAELGFKSTSTVHLYLKQLEEFGAISKSPNQNRTIRLRGEAITQVPLLGTVQAGSPILAVEEIQDYIPFRNNKKREGDLFALRVRGDSMIDAGIFEGDFIIVEQTSSVQDGEIIVALMEEEATVKRLFRRDGRILLHPENSAMEDIITTEEDCRILGKVISIIRNLQ